MTKRIISVIEDNHALRRSLVAVLETQGFSAQGFVDGHDFLDQMAQTPSPDIIISDVQMPLVSGLELLKQLRGAGIKTPVILMSASLDDRLPATCIECGASNFLYKPFEPQHLIDQIEKVLSSLTSINR